MNAISYLPAAPTPASGIAPVITTEAAQSGPAESDDPLRYISASRLKCWQTCRRQFYFRYIERVHTPMAQALFVGQQVHEILRVWNWARWKDEPCDTEELHQVFDEQWQKEVADNDIAWKDDDDQAKAKAQAWSLLETYFAQPSVDPQEKPEGVEVRVECDLLLPGAPPLLGIIDLVRPGGRIVDYKTAARTPDPDLTAHQHQTQLACYALLYRESTGQRETGFELHHLIKTKQPKIMVITLDPMSVDMERELYALIRDYLSGIDDERWIPSPGQHCGWCDHLDRCRGFRVS